MFKRSRPYAIELDGVCYSYSENRLKQIADLKDAAGDQWFVSDMHEAISRTMTVEGHVKYAEHLVRRNLQETGEFDEPVSIITHWKQKRGKTHTDIFFTALPTRHYYRYFDQIAEHEDSILLFPLYSILLGTLKRVRPQKPVAVIFQHNRFADLVVGTKKRVYYANRFVTFDTADEQISSLWDTIRTDIHAVESDHRIKVAKVFTLTWIDSGALPEWEDDEECEYYSFEEEAVSLNGEVHHISFLKVVGEQSDAKGISPLKEKILYNARRFAPYLNVLFLIAAIIFIGGYFYYNTKTDRLHKDLTRLEREIAGVQAKSYPEIPQVSYQSSRSFIKDLVYYKSAPSYKSVINDLSDALSSDMKLEVLKLDYNPDEVGFEVFGRITAPFDFAHRKYQSFLGIMSKRGYTVKESRFDTQIRDSQFLTKLTKRIR